MKKKIIGLSFPANNANLGLEPSILNVLPPGDEVVYTADNNLPEIPDVDKYLCSVYISGFDEFKGWAKKHDPKKIIVGGYHPTMFPENFLDLADKVVVGPCDDLEATLSQDDALFERGYYDGTKMGNARFVSGRILKTSDPRQGWIRTKGEISGNSTKEQPSGNAEIIRGKVLPGVLTFRNAPRYDLYDIRNNQQIIPEKKMDDLVSSINTSFGCFYRCDFCCTPPMFGSHLISKPLEAAEREVQIVKDRFRAFDDGSKQKFLFIRDENFALQKDYKQKLEMISKTGARVYLFASANSLSDEVVENFSKNNVYLVCLGLEDPTKSYAKNKTLGEAIGRLKKKGIFTYLSFIVDPLMVIGAAEAKGFYDLLYKNFEELKPEMVCGNFLMPFPGTPLWDKYYHLVSEEDFKHYDSKTPFLIKNQLVHDKMRYFMFDIQWKYFNSELYNKEVRRFDVEDTLHLRFLELKDMFEQSFNKIRYLRP